MSTLRQAADGAAQDASRPSFSGKLLLDDQNPWPGPAAYEEASSRFFFGRSNEASELLRLIRLAPLTVVYGKSGLGKTSLLQAGLYPLLRAEHYLPVHVRLDFSDGLKDAPLKQVMQRLMEELDGARAEYPAPGSDESLWRYLHRDDLELVREDGRPITPVLVLDQFEELFSRSGGNTELIRQVIYGLAELVENRIPAELAGDEAWPMRSNLDLRSQSYRVVLSFREDFLPEVRTWEHVVPSLLRYCLRLEPMSRLRAIEAVEQAGKAVLDNDVAPCIVDLVGRQDPASGAADTGDLVIEPVLLSLCCYQLNRRRPPGARIDRALVEEAGQDILDRFYRETLGDPDVKGPPDVAHFIEDYLIQGDDFRGDYPKEGALSNGFLTGEQLTALTDRHRLLRIVHRDTTRIELIHDRLVPVVRKARDERRVKRHQEEQESLARAAQAEWDKERARSGALQRQRDVANRSFRAAKLSRNIAAVVAIVSLIAIAWGFYLNQQKEQLKQRMALAVDTTSLAEGKRAFRPGSEPLEQTLYQGLAAYRLAAGFPELRAPSLTALHSAMGVSGHLLKALRINDLMPTPALAYSPDGKTLAVGGENGMVQLLDAVTYRETARLDCGQSPDEAVWALSFNSDGKRLAAGYASTNEKVPGSGLVCVFDLSDQKPKRRWSAKDLWGIPGSIYGLAYGGKPGAEFVISGGSDKMLRKLDVETSRVRELPQQDEVAGVAVTMDGLRVASGGEDGIIRVWNLADFDNPKAQPVELEGHENTIQQVVFSPADPSILVSAGDDGKIIAWDIRGGCLSQKSEPQTARIYNVAVGKDGLIAAASADGNVRLFRLLEKGAQCGGPGTDTASGMVDAPEFKILADGVLSGHGGVVLGVAFNNEIDRLASTGQDGSIRIWGPKPGGFSLAQLALGSGLGGATSLAISPDGKYVAAGDEVGNIHLWDRPKETGPQRQTTVAYWKAHEEAILSLAYIRIGNQLALVSGGDDGVLRRWEPATRNAIGPDMADNAKPVRSIAVSPDGRMLAAGSSDGTVRLWHTATGRRDRTVDKRKDAAEGYELHAVGFSADGNHLAVGDTFAGLRIVDLEKPGSERILQGNGAAVRSISRSGTAWLLTASQDGSILEWDHADLSRPEGKGIKKHDEFKFRMQSRRAKPLTSITTSADGALILAGGNEGHIQLWEGIERVQIGARFLGRQGSSDIRAVALDPDGNFFVTVDASTVLVWPGPDRWADIICSKLVSNMSRKQWREWVSNDIPYTCQCPGLPILSDDPASGKPVETCPAPKPKYSTSQPR